MVFKGPFSVGFLVTRVQGCVTQNIQPWDEGMTEEVLSAAIVEQYATPAFAVARVMSWEKQVLQEVRKAYAHFRSICLVKRNAYPPFRSFSFLTFRDSESHA